MQLCLSSDIDALRWICGHEVLPHVVLFWDFGSWSEEKVLAGFFGVEETKEQAGNCSEIQFAGLVSVFLIFEVRNGIYFCLNFDPGAKLI